MFKRLLMPEAKEVTVMVEDKSVTVAESDNAATALFAAGFDHSGLSPVNNRPRSPYCMMGVCFECLVEIDGVPNRQACMTPVKNGMHIKLQKGAADLDS